MTIWEKITNALNTWTPMDMLIVATLVLIPLITVVLILLTIANNKKRKRMKDSGTAEEPVAATVVAAPVVKRERRVRHITTNAPQRVRVRVRTKNLCKVDRSLLVATGIFGVGLGIMIHRAADGRR